MAFFRRWFLVLSALVLGGGPLFAATREERAYAAALDAFHDQFYGRAEAGLTQFLQTYRKSASAPQAVLLLAQSEFYLGKYQDAIGWLADSNNLARAKTAGLTDRYVYWTAEARFALGDFRGAAKTFISLAHDFPESPLGLSAVVEAAAAWGQIPDWPRVDDLLDKPDGLFQRAAQLDPASESVAAGRLLQAASKCSQQDFAAALKILNGLNPAMLTPEQDWNRAHLLGRADLGLNDLEAALTATTNLLEIARHGRGNGWATNLAASVAFRASVLEKMGRLAEAGAAWQENLTNGVPVGQQEAVLKMAELAVAQNHLADAEANLEKFLAQSPASPAAEPVWLALGELHLKEFVARPATTNQLAAAQTNLDQLLAVTTNGPLAGKAFLDRGWCHWLARQYPESLADFQAAARALPSSEDQAVARFKMGDARFKQKDFSGARADYEAVLNDYANLPAVGPALGELSLYQCLRANLALDDASGANDTLARILKTYPEGDLSDNAILLVAEKADDARQPAVARALLEKFEKRYPDSELLPQARMAVARTYEQEANWPAAITNYEGWLRDFPTNDLRPQMEYALALANFHADNEAKALAQFTAFIGQFPTNALAPLAHWWVADHFFRLGGTNLVAAELNYELIYQDFPTNELAGNAQIMAGRAAMGRFDYTGAIKNYFIPLLNDTNCPEELKVPARFAYAASLMQTPSTDTNNPLANFQTATNILSQMSPTNEAGVRALGEIGNCDLQLGDFDGATNAYAQVANSPLAGAGLHNQAKVGLGLVLEKKADGLLAPDRKILLAMALDDYLDVVYSPADEFWTKKAGLQALPLIGSVGGGDANQVDDFFDRLEELLPQLKDSLEKKRAALKN